MRVSWWRSWATNKRPYSAEREYKSHHPHDAGPKPVHDPLIDHCAALGVVFQVKDSDLLADIMIGPIGTRIILKTYFVIFVILKEGD